MLKQAVLAAIILASASLARAESGAGFSYPVGLDENGDNFLALRSRPTTLEGVRLRKLGPGTLFRVTGRQGAWVNVRLLDGESGWVYGRYVGCCARGPQAPASAVAPTTRIGVPADEGETARLRGQVEQLKALVRANQEREARRERETAAARQAPPGRERLVADEDALAALSARSGRATATPGQPSGR